MTAHSSVTSLRRVVATWNLLPIAALSALCMWPTDGTEPVPGYDSSWTLALQLGRRLDLGFGDEIVFTYGPLGFSLFPSSLSRSGLLVSIAVLTVLLGTFGVLTHRLLRLRLDPLPAGVVTALIVLLAPSSGAAFCDILILAMFATMIDLVRRHRPPLVWWSVGLGALAALLLLTKVSTGFVALAGVLVMSLSPGARPNPGWQRIVAAVGAFLVTFLVGWLALGQPITGIPRYLLRASQISNGYSWSMGYAEPGRRWELFAAAAVVIAVLGATVRWVIRARRADGGFGAGSSTGWRW